MPTLHGGDSNALGRIDHYDLLRKLVGGGFGVVYLAKDSNSGVEVALKTLHPLLKTNAEEMDALREKFALVSRLSHPNIATALVLHPVREVNIWDEAARKEMRLSPGDSVMVMRYAPGVTLSRWRRQFPDGIVPLDLALEIARQLASRMTSAKEKLSGDEAMIRDAIAEHMSCISVKTVPGKDGSSPLDMDPKTGEVFVNVQVRLDTEKYDKFAKNVVKKLGSIASGREAIKGEIDGSSLTFQRENKTTALFVVGRNLRIPTAEVLWGPS